MHRSTTTHIPDLRRWARVSNAPFDFSKDSRTIRKPTYDAGSPAAFAARTKIETPHGEGLALVPFRLWPEQITVAERLHQERLIIILKARQLGISWLTCAYVLWLCVRQAGRTVLLFSQGQLEANELIHRIRTLEHHHVDRPLFPQLTTDNTAELAWDNGSRVLSLAATRRAGRSFTASLVVLDEFAFMQWGSDVLSAVKPTIDAGGKLVVISSADGNGSPYHQFWQAAESGSNGYTPIFLPWQARPDRYPGWRDQKVIEASGDTASVLREYPANAIEAFTHASGLVYDVWADPGNVTEDAEYVEGAGPVYWAVDDGYSGARDPKTGSFTADSHPRVFLLIQEQGDGRLCVFHEDYRVKALSDQHIADMLALDYPAPEYVALDSAAAELRGRLNVAGLYTRGKPTRVEESIKTTRRMLAADANGYRRILIHPRCKHLRSEMASYRYDQQTEQPVKQFDHGPDALRYFAFTKRLEG